MSGRGSTDSLLSCPGFSAVVCLPSPWTRTLSGRQEIILGEGVDFCSGFDLYCLIEGSLPRCIVPPAPPALWLCSP